MIFSQRGDWTTVSLSSISNLNRPLPNKNSSFIKAVFVWEQWIEKTEISFFKILSQNWLYSFIFFSRRASKKIPMRLKTTSFLCNAIETKQRNNSFKSCLALWPMRLLLVFIPTPKTKIFGSGPNKTKSPNGWFLLFARRMSFYKLRIVLEFLYFQPFSATCDHLLSVTNPNNKLFWLRTCSPQMTYPTVILSGVIKTRPPIRLHHSINSYESEMKLSFKSLYNLKIT